MLNVGYVGHLYEGRGIGLLIELARRCAWLHMHIVGGDPEDVRRWQAECREVPNITFYGYVVPNETNRYREMCEVLVAPYQQTVKVAGNRVDTSKWMSPLKIFEYMASGRAIVASNLPVLREVLENEVNALLCDTGDVDQWRNAICRLNDDPGLRKRLARRAYLDYRKRYTWVKRAERMISEFGSG